LFATYVGQVISVSSPDTEAAAEREEGSADGTTVPRRAL
jgi:hypothetical protein